MDVKGFPTMVFYNKGRKIPFQGARTKDGIISWLKKKTGAASSKIECDELEKLSKSANYMVAYFGEESSSLYSDVQIPMALSSKDNIEFVHNSNKDCA